MYLQYDLDLNRKETVWIINTPTPIAYKLPFYVNECGNFIAGSNYYTIREGKNDYIMVYSIIGRGAVEYKDEVYHLVPNTCIVCDCRLRSNFYSLEDRWSFYFLHFDGTAAKGIADVLATTKREFVTIQHPEIVHSEMNRLFRRSQSGEIAAFLDNSHSIHHLMNEILLSGATYQGTLDDEAYRNEVQLALQYLNAHYSEKITLDDILSVVHLSKYHFIRIFKQYMGTTPYHYLQIIRVSRAKYLLRETDLPVAEIGQQVGLPDANNFIRIFRQIERKTPLQYRKMLFR